jgi:hypothetical protein
MKIVNGDITSWYIEIRIGLGCFGNRGIEAAMTGIPLARDDYLLKKAAGCVEGEIIPVLTGVEIVPGK